VLGVGVDGEQLFEAEGFAASGDFLQGFFGPVGFELAIECGEAGG